MADDGYVQSGKGWLTSVANWASYVPFLGAPITFAAGVLDTLIESTGWLLRLKPLSAATTLTAGGISTAVNTASSTLGGLPNLLASGTGHTLGTHARKVTETAIGGTLGVVGMRPTVVRSYTAGVGSVNGGFSRPGQWANYVSQRSGRDPNQQWADYVRAQQGAQVGMQR